MIKSLSFYALVLAAGALLAPVARADLYSATKAVESGDLPRAFELYRELAELGRLEAQQSLAAMYVNGEGVKRDNVLGYAWAVIAREHGGDAAMQSIVEQLNPHMTENARRRVKELQSQFGQEALRKRLLPAPWHASLLNDEACAFRKPANPNNYFPREAIQRGLSGNVLLMFTVLPDGRARHPRVWLAIPAGVFDEAARQVVFDSTFTPRRENGVAKPCTMRIKVKFTLFGPDDEAPNAEVLKHFEATKAKAEAGDPISQMVYGFLLSGVSAVEHERENSLPWFVEAAQAGLPSAQFMVGVQLMSGYGAPKDENKGLAWLRMAAAAGHADAQVALASYLLRDDSGATALATALDLLERAAASGSQDGKFSLAALLAAGPDATRRDPKRAIALLDQIIYEVDSDPVAYEILAAAHAMLGNFKIAQRHQEIALGKARKLVWDVAPLQARLSAYEAKTSWSGTLIVF